MQKLAVVSGNYTFSSGKWEQSGKHKGLGVILSDVMERDRLVGPHNHDMPYFDVYITRGVIICIGYARNYAVFSPRGKPRSIVPMTWDELDSMRMLPENYDIPF